MQIPSHVVCCDVLLDPTRISGGGETLASLPALEPGSIESGKVGLSSGKFCVGERERERESVSVCARSRAHIPRTKCSRSHAPRLAAGKFYKFTVTAAAATNGVVFCAKGKRKNDRFRILTFDKKGNVKHMAEAHPVPEKGNRQRPHPPTHTHPRASGRARTHTR